ncbi:MAG: bifunctional 5,10-methylene-tetrahydrofolate dehydrogenase/5,10-methylene-tetrahydrofolate cyclohydrolase [Candidatus Aenigmatarchaeota archaeon]|nr:MAG: bifunctional 5,10-methylene-tetrahydrofolate dehydrogenase/5,10-methylene-tetrahydrofolate cyclohydrolase [Candidatus Aenigmarchaeota archaeon]
MMAEIIDGKKIAEEIEKNIKAELDALEKKYSKRPCLAVILVGENAASKIYVQKKEEACDAVGVLFKKIELPEATTEQELIKIIRELNNDNKIHGILVQLPLPTHIDSRKIINTISPTKDVDGLTAENMGNLLLNNEKILPCTPLGIITMLKKIGVGVEGKNVVIVNHSKIVGRPLAAMLLNRNATPTICHIKTKDLKSQTLDADILVTATGVPGLIKADMVKNGAVVIDGGIKKVGEKVVGDVEFESVLKKASYITPVPGGVGPMTVAMVLVNLVELFKEQIKK